MDNAEAKSFSSDRGSSGEAATAPAAMERNKAYDMVDRYLRNNLDDTDYAEYSTALEIVWRCPSEFTQWVDRVAETVGDGGPAFPCEVDSTQPLHRQVGNTVWQTYGLTMRDYFAAQFMERAQSLSETRDGGWDFQNAAQCCYAMADEMLKARQS
jgi:hypothetical protein